MHHLITCEEARNNHPEEFEKVWEQFQASKSKRKGEPPENFTG